MNILSYVLLTTAPAPRFDGLDATSYQAARGSCRVSPFILLTAQQTGVFVQDPRG